MLKTCEVIELSGASVLVEKTWPVGSTITISFINGKETDRAFVRTHSSEWLKYANLHFDWVERDGMVRIAIGNQGSWSMLGHDAMAKRSGPTMEFGWLDRAVVLHEFGHMLGLNHSHMSKNFPYHFNERAVIADLSGPPNNWPLGTIRSNVLNKTTEAVFETPWEANGVMNYYCPASWISEGVEISPGDEIGPQERALISHIYPAGGEVGRPRLEVGQTISGQGNSDFDFICTTGMYVPKVLPRTARVLINGKNFTLRSIRAGTYIVTVITRGNFNLTIRRF